MVRRFLRSRWRSRDSRELPTSTRRGPSTAPASPKADARPQECRRAVQFASDGENLALDKPLGSSLAVTSCKAAAFICTHNLFLFKISRYRGGCSRPSTQEFAAAMNDHVTSAAPAPAPPKSRQFWNWKLIGGEIILTVLGVYLFVAQAPRLSGMAGLVVGVLGIWLLLSEFRGFAVASKAISFPSRFANFPILSLRRMSVSPASVRELTVMQTWFSFQVVEIHGGFGTELLLFQSRGQRLRFTSAVEAICPNANVFRQKPLPKEYELQ